MSKKINTTTLGLFIVAGLALGAAGLVVFSSAKFFTRTQEVIVYFDGSLNGLDEGAPVKYRGVTIGSVKRVMVRFNQATNDFTMPVILEVREDLLRDRLGEPAEIFSERSLTQRIHGGLRASLQTESLVTGVLYVDIRPNPTAPEPVFHQVNKIYPELPSEPTQIQKLFNNLASLDLKSLEQNLNALITRLDTTISELNIAQIQHHLTNLLASTDQLVSSPEITNALAGIRPTLDQYRDLAASANRRIDPLADGLTHSLAEADRAFADVASAAQNLRDMLAPDAPVPRHLDQSLQQLSSAVQSLSVLLDFLKQNPNALITGRERKEKRP